jgi:hypothetical protein
MRICVPATNVSDSRYTIGETYSICLDFQGGLVIMSINEIPLYSYELSKFKEDENDQEYKIAWSLKKNLNQILDKLL